jgi:dihydrodipicolinate synthase/N-acetylneuraminate lyase
MTAPEDERAPSTFCVTITPFDADLRLDVDALRLIVDRLAAGGVGAFVGSSSPGEGFSLSREETEQLYGEAKDAMAGRQEVRAMGVEPRRAEETYELIKIAESVGLDAMQLYCLDLGHSNQPGDEELERFFRTNLERMTIPAVLSTHVMVGYLIPIRLLEKLLDSYSHIIGINCTTPNLGYLKQVLDVAAGRVDVHVGGPQQAVTALALGAQGFLCTEAMIAPKLCGSLVGQWAAGEYPAAFETYRRILSVSAINRWPNGSLRFTKAAMRVLGLPGWHLRPPYVPLDDDARHEIERGLEKLEFLAEEGLAPVAQA